MPNGKGVVFMWLLFAGMVVIIAKVATLIIETIEKENGKLSEVQNWYIGNWV